MVEVIGQRCVHFGKRKVILGCDLIRAHSHALMPDNDVLNGDTVAGDRGFPLATPGVISMCSSSVLGFMTPRSATECNPSAFYSIT
jgi:hypothetical protein